MVAPGNFAQLSTYLLGNDRVHLIVPIGPADKEHAEDYCHRISSDRMLPVTNLSLTELAALLKRCMVCVGNDSGVTHMAAAVGTPVVALFGPTDPRVWGPRGNRVHIHLPGSCMFSLFPGGDEWVFAQEVSGVNYGGRRL